MSNTQPGATLEVTRTIAKIQSGVLAMTCAVLGGVGLFVMTAWLLIKDGPQVGLHLQLLRHYFIGYSVSWPGSLVGLFYGAVVGGVIGWSIGRIYNGVVRLRERGTLFGETRSAR
jgi:hypothetical protein